MVEVSNSHFFFDEFCIVSKITKNIYFQHKYSEHLTSSSYYLTRTFITSLVLKWKLYLREVLKY